MLSALTATAKRDAPLRTSIETLTIGISSFLLTGRSSPTVYLESDRGSRRKHRAKERLLRATLVETVS
jgi:hypothetical protein